MKKKYFILFIITFIIVFIISMSVAIFSRSNNNTINNKIDEEINYLDNKLIGMINCLNNIPFSNTVLLEQSTMKIEGNKNESSESEKQESSEYSKFNIENVNILNQDENKIDWNYMKNTVQIIYTTWPTIMLDLHSVNVKNDDILLFSNTLDKLVISIENENKNDTLNLLTIMYSILPIFIEQYSYDYTKINIHYTKSYIINSYALSENEKWNEMYEEIKKGLDVFMSVINTVNENNNQSDINKTYIALNNMLNVINLHDKKLFYLKYINLMEGIMQIK